MEHAVRTIKISDLFPNPWNTNVVSPENQSKIEESIKRFGMFKPLVVRTLSDGRLEILGGQHRWEAAKALGIEQVEVVDLGEIDDKKAKEISLVDNGRYGVDDGLRLSELLRELGDVEEYLPYSEADLNQIFIGSEGTYGIITKAQMRIYEQPETRRFRGFLFKDMHGAFAAGREILQKFKPSVMRLYDDAETASLIKKIVGVEKPGAFMNVAYEGVKDLVDVEERILLDTFKRYGAEDLGCEYGEKWWKEKITFFYPGHMLDLPQMFGTMDTIAPYGKIEKIYWAMKKAVETNFPQAKFIAHFSHWYEWGCMIYDRFIIEGKDVPDDPVEAMRLHNAVWTLGVRTAIENGGVVNDHHGVGIKLGRLMKEQYGPAMQVFEGLKKSLDPNGIMNPYKLGL